MSDMIESKDDDDELAVLGDGPDEMKAANSVPIKFARDRSVPIDIYPWFEITVQDIDVCSQKWHASIEIHLFWQDFSIPAQNPNFEENGITFGDPENDCPVKLSEIFENKVWEDADSVVLKYLPETSTIYMLLVVAVEFVERMELQRFPMDRQFLGMDFNAWVGIDDNGNRCNWNWIMNPPQWVPKEFRKPFAVRMLSSITEYECLSPWIDFSKETQPLSIKLRVERQPGYYFGSIILPNFLIVAAAFAAFPISIDDEEPSFIADRLSISVTLMLTAVAFRYVVTEQLPMITYLTIMDYYLLEGFVILTLFIGENAFVGITTWNLISSQQTRNDIDNLFAYAFLIIWGLTHILWLIVLFNKNFMRIPWKKMSILDDQDEEEWQHASTKRNIGNPQSKEVLDEWAKFKGKSPRLRASVYAEQHPELAKDDSD